VIDKDVVKRAAEGRWVEILSSLGGIDPQTLDVKRHVPCPKCGGDDRFRMLDEQSGAVYCNQCFNKENGDGIAALMWLLECDFPTAMKHLAEFLGIQASDTPLVVDVIADVARRKRMPLESFKAFGAFESSRSGFIVARVPMYDESRVRCSSFDMAYIESDPQLAKGKCESGKPSGLFVAEWPNPGDTVLLTEGVKDAAMLHSLKYLAVGYNGAELLAKFARVFQGCKVIIVPDRDTTGEEKARVTAARLFGVAESVRIATLPGEIKAKNGDGVREVFHRKNGEKLLRQAIDDAVIWTVEGEQPVKNHVRLVNGIHDYLDSLEAGGEFTYKCGIPEVDASIGGVAPGELVIIGARPSQGKSMICMQWLDNYAKAGHPGFMVSEEMSSRALSRRSVLYETDIPEQEWKTKLQRVRFDVNSHHEDRKDIFVVESCVTITRVLEEVDRAVSDHGIKIAAVDYVQLLKGSRRGMNAYEEVTEAVTSLKRCAKKHKIVMIGLAQLGRDIDKRAERAPKMSDLKGTGQIEQDADVILFLQWPWKEDPTFPRKDEYLIYVGKNREREIATAVISTRFNPSRQRLESGMPKNDDSHEF